MTCQFLISSLITKDLFDFGVMWVDWRKDVWVFIHQILVELLCDEWLSNLRRMEAINRLNQLPRLSTASFKLFDGYTKRCEKISFESRAMRVQTCSNGVGEVVKIKVLERVVE